MHEEVEPAPVPERPHALKEAWSLLRRNRDFRLFYIGELVSFAGDWFLLVALAELVLRLTDSAGLVAAIFVCFNFPYGVISFIGGPLADRLDRRRMMIVTNVAMGALSLGYFAVNSRDDLWILFLLTIGISAVSALFEPAASAAVPNLVDEDDLAAANMLNGSAWGTMLAVGAGVGGLVVAAWGNNIAYSAEALSFFIAAALLVMVHRATSQEREPHEKHPGIVDATKEAVRYSRQDHRVMILYAIRLGAGFAIGVGALLPVLATDVFHAGSRGTGFLFAMRGIGSLMGPFLARPLLRREGMPYFSAMACLAGFSALFAVAPWMPSIFLAGLVLVAATMAGAGQWVVVTYAYQTIVPDRVLGRVFGFDGALITFTLAASNALCGWLAGTWSVGAVMTAVGVSVCAYLLLLWVLTANLRHRG